MIKKAVILAAGEGRRMRPLTNKTHKSMLYLNGQPIISYLVKMLENVGILDIIVVVGYGKENLVDFLSYYYPEINFKFVEQLERKGTAHAIGLTEKYLKEDFLVLNGDVLFEPQLLNQIFKRYKKNHMILVAEKVKDPRPYGVFEIRNGKIVSICEKPEKPISNLINAGIYLFTPQIFDAIRKTPLSSRGEYEITSSIQILLNEGVTADYIIYTDTRLEATCPEDIKKIEAWIKRNLNKSI